MSKVCRNEIYNLQRLSNITDTSVFSLIHFNEKEFCDEVKKICPVITAVLDGAMGSYEEKPNTGPKATCLGVIFKTRLEIFFF